MDLNFHSNLSLLFFFSIQGQSIRGSVETKGVVALNLHFSPVCCRSWSSPIGHPICKLWGGCEHICLSEMKSGRFTGLGTHFYFLLITDFGFVILPSLKLTANAPEKMANPTRKEGVGSSNNYISGARNVRDSGRVSGRVSPASRE